MHSIDGPKGTTVSFNTLNAPKKARDAFEKAGKELHKEKVDFKKVRKHLKKATEIYPEFAAAWQLLGQANLASGDRKEARNSFRHALEADPNYVKAITTDPDLETLFLHMQGTGISVTLKKR